MATKKKNRTPKTWTCPECNIVHPKAYTYCGGCKGEKDDLSAKHNHQKQAAASAAAKAAKAVKGAGDAKAALSPKAAPGAAAPASPSPNAAAPQAASPKVASPNTPPRMKAPQLAATDEDSADMTHLKS